MSNKLPIIAIVGRANVGKSSLFNAILGSQEAIVAKEAGTTRDSIMAKAEFNNHQFWLVDTAGVKDPEDEFEFTIQEQIIQATDSADIIWVVVENNSLLTEEDRKVAKLALKSAKPVFLIVNKIDQKTSGQNFERLGIQPIMFTSAKQNRGIRELIAALLKTIPKVKQARPSQLLSIAIVGRPNVGKSYLFNTLAKKQQAIVSERAGTTRDINRIAIKYKGQAISLLDTAGIRRNGKIKVGVERFSVIRTLKAIEEADICLMLMDVNELNVQLDQKIAGMVKDAGKGLVLVVSKWDSVKDKDAFTRDNLAPQIAANFDFVPWAPLIFVSSLTGQNVSKIFDLALDIYKTRQSKIATSQLNRWLQQTVLLHPPAGLKNRSPKLNYMVQEIDNDIPAFKVFGSQTKFIHWSYRRYLETQLRKSFGFEGSPVQLWFIEKHLAHKHGVSPTKEKAL